MEYEYRVIVIDENGIRMTKFYDHLTAFNDYRKRKEELPISSFVTIEMRETW